MAEREYSEMHLRIGDIGFAVASGDPSLVLEAQGAARRFVSAAGAPDVRLIAAWANSHAPEPGELLFDAGSIWKVYRQGDGYQMRFHAPQFGPRPYRTALFNADFTSGELLLMTLLINVFWPFGLPAGWSPASGVMAGLGWLAAKLAILSGVIVLVETANAKMRLFRVPELMAVAFTLGALALISTFLF